MGVAAAATAVVASILPDALAFAAPEIAGGLLGAGVGAVGSEITGGNPLYGALAGGVTGGFIPAGGAIGGSLGGSTGATIGDVAGGLAGGALGATATGTNPLTGALEGGVSGGLAAALSPSTGTPSGTTGTSPSAPAAGGGTGGPGGGAAGTAAPASVPIYDQITGLPTGGATAPASAGSVTPTGDTMAGYTGIGGGSTANVGATIAPSGSITPAAVPPPSGGLDQASLAALNTPGPGGAPAGGGGGFNFGLPPTNSLLNPPATPSYPAGASSVTAGGTPTIGPGQSDSFLSNIFGGGGTTTQPATPVAGTGGAAAPAGPADVGLFGSPGGFLNKLTSPGALLAAGGLGYEALTAPKVPSISGISSTLQGQAGQLAGQSAQLESYLSSGTLPPGVQASLTQAGDAAKAAIRSRYAAMGASGSSAEQQDLANVDQTVVTNGANIAMQLLQTGITEGQLSSQLYQTILQTSLQSNAALSSAIGNFAGAAAGGGTTLKLVA